MPRPDLSPEFDDSHFPPLGEGSQAEIAAAAGFKPKHPSVGSANGSQNPGRLQARELRAIELAAAGATYDHIGRIIGITRSAARQLVERALARRALEVKVRELPVAKALQADRLDALWRRWYPLALGDGATTPPDPRAASVVLSIHDRMCRLHGLEDTSIQVEQHITIVTDAEERARRETILADLAEVGRRLQDVPAIEGTWEEAS